MLNRIAEFCAILGLYLRANNYTKMFEKSQFLPAKNGEEWQNTI